MPAARESHRVDIEGPVAALVIVGPIRPPRPLPPGPCAALENCRNGVLVCDVTGIPVDVDALARLALGARRRGCRVALRGATAELCELVDLRDWRRCWWSDRGTRSSHESLGCLLCVDRLKSHEDDGLTVAVRRGEEFEGAAAMSASLPSTASTQTTSAS